MCKHTDKEILIVICLSVCLFVYSLAYLGVGTVHLSLHIISIYVYFHSRYTAKHFYRLLQKTSSVKHTHLAKRCLHLHYTLATPQLSISFCIGLFQQVTPPVILGILLFCNTGNWADLQVTLLHYEMLKEKQVTRVHCDHKRI